MTVRRVPVKRSKFDRMCEVYDEGTFVAQCCTWHRLQEVRTKDGGMHDEVDAAVLLHTVDR